MKNFVLLPIFLLAPLAEAYAASPEPAAEQLQPMAQAVQRAHRLKLSEQAAWQRLLYMDSRGRSEVSYAGFFLAEQSLKQADAELDAAVEALFQPAAPNASIRCRFPARSQWLMQELGLPEAQLPEAACPELDEWYGKIKPHKAVLIYATDFMGNPSSMFGHTLLRIDPENQQQLNLVSYAVNYAATVQNADSWSYAWKGLTGQYPGEYSIMPYYRKVKEYGDFESRDLWEYELNLTPAETQFLVKHIWEMQQVSFPYYFSSDNCAYRLLGLFDLARPALNLAAGFKGTAIPAETVKAAAKQGLIQQTAYRPALETQLLAQANLHGASLAKTASKLARTGSDIAELLQPYSELERAQILEMAYDDLYLAFNAREAAPEFAQPRLRRILTQRSRIAAEKQRAEVNRPKFDPSQGHHARRLSMQAGEVQGEHFTEIGLRQAYHDLIDPQRGYRIGTQLLFLDGAAQYRSEQLKLSALDLLTVNSYNPVTPFKQPLSWGFNLGWKQEALQQDGQFSEHEQHGAAYLNMQAGYSWANAKRTQLCYAQMQTQLQGSQALDLGWRAGFGPAAGCQSIWNAHLNTALRAELPFWTDASVWNLRVNAELQYQVQPQHGLHAGYQYQQQDSKHWDQFQIGYRFYY